MAQVRTVLGDVAAEDLGVCYGHDHLLCAPPESYRTPDLTLDDRSAAREELESFVRAGGGAVVEMSTPDYGRDAEGLAELARATGVHLVAATGYNKGAYFPESVRRETVVDLADRFADEVEEGIDPSGDRPVGGDVQAGVIKAGSGGETIGEAEEKVFRAAARAHRETGAPISTHTEAGAGGLEQLDLLEEEGVPARRVIVGHVDRRLDPDYHRALAERGAFLSFDQIGKEKYDPDAVRIACIRRLVAEGHEDRILLGGDMARRSYWPAYGRYNGPGYTYVLWRFVPRLREEGLTEETLDRLLVENPRSAFALRA